MMIDLFHPDVRRPWRDIAAEIAASQRSGGYVPSRPGGHAMRPSIDNAFGGGEPPRCGGLHPVFGLLVQSDGRAVPRVFCSAHADERGLLILTDQCDRSALPPDLVIMRRNPPRRLPSCSYDGCSAPGAEIHHFAPRHVFGPVECERWPVAPLCPKHHREWHKRIREHR